MAEYMAVKRENICLMLEGVSYEEAAMCEPTAAALHAFRKSGAGLGDTLLIYGIGTIGLIMAQWAKAAGVKNIILVARTDDKVEFAKSLGFPLAVNAKREDLGKLVQEVTNGLGADACIEGTGASEPWAECISLAKVGGRVVCLGNSLGGMSLTQDAYWKILRKELILVWVLGTAVSAAERMTGGRLSKQCKTSGWT